MTKYNEVSCVDKKKLVCNTDHIEVVELVNLMGQTAQGLYMISNFLEHDDVQWMKHMIP